MCVHACMPVWVWVGMRVCACVCVVVHVCVCVCAYLRACMRACKTSCQQVLRVDYLKYVGKERVVALRLITVFTEKGGVRFQ